MFNPLKYFGANTRYDRAASAAKRQQNAAGLTGDFATQAAANPYEGKEFTPSFWTNIAEKLFGDYSARDSFYQQQDQSADEYIANLIDAQRQQKYNSPEQQAARERAAGINPDIAGQTVGEPAAAAAADDTPPEGMTQDQDVQKFVETGISLGLSAFGDPMSMLQTVVGTLDTLNNIGIKSDQRTWMEVNNYLASFPQMVDLVAGTEPGNIGRDPLSASGYDAWRLGRLDSSFSYQLNNSGLSKKAQSILKQLRGQVRYDKNGKPTRALERAIAGMDADKLEQLQKSIGIKNSPGYDDDFVRWQSKNYEDLAKYENEAAKAKARLNIRLADVGLRINEDGNVQLLIGAQNAKNAAAIAEGNYTAGYYDTADSETAAGSFNAENSANIARKSLDKFFTELESNEQHMYEDRIKEIDSVSNPVIRNSLKMAEHKRHAEWRANHLHTRESITNQVIDQLVTGAIDQRFDEHAADKQNSRDMTKDAASTLVKAAAKAALKK